MTGFAVVTAADPDLACDLARRVGPVDATTRPLVPGTWLVQWGGPAGHDDVVVTVRAPRARTRDVTPDDLGALLGTVPGRDDALARVLPPFAALGRVDDEEVVVAVDWLGFRHAYTADGDGWAAVSSSAGELGGLLGAGLDRAALGVQAMLGWQLGARTLHAGVRRLGPGERAVLAGGRLRVDGPADPRGTTTAVPAHGGERPEARAAEGVREVVGAFLDDHPDALLQLTGGLDSRILLGAIPRRRRAEVEAMTLVVPGSPDAEIAGRLAREHGMRHHLVTLDGLDRLPPAEVWARVRAASERVDGTADPPGLAVLLWAERDLAVRPRLAGLGGEVARGFYYLGPPVPVPVTRALAAGLARWRLTPNERVAAGALEPAFDAEAGRRVADDTHAALVASGRRWWAATDELYLWERMGRWAGVLASATCTERATVNPMLDRAFVDLVRTVRPAAKRNMRLLSRILLELDRDLADVGLDHRPAPVHYATRSWRGSASLAATQARKVRGKVGQRLHGTTRPPAGGDTLAAAVVEHWRAHPELLDPARGRGVLSEEWLDGVLRGSVTPAATTVSFVVNLVVAAGHQPPGRPVGQAGTSREPQPSTAGRVEGRTSARTEARD